MNPKIYLVGGSVRDILMGRTPQDKDFVVIGANHQWMIDNGFSHVGQSFPVYLHPETGDEYALARREKKTGVGYTGFEVETENVTLEEDLSRRDFRFNAMALDQDMNLIDPFGGRKDIENKVIRHTSDAFAEDPVRVLRMARFAARYDFDVHPDTIRLARSIAHEIDDVNPERVWKEIRRALREPYVEKFFDLVDLTCNNKSKIIDSIFYDCPVSLEDHEHRIFAAFTDVETLVATYFSPSKENHATNMAIDLHKMKTEFMTTLNHELVDFVVKWRLTHDTDRSREFMKMIKMIVRPEFNAKLTDCIHTIKNFKFTEEQIAVLNGLKGKAIGDQTRQYYKEAFYGRKTTN